MSAVSDSRIRLRYTLKRADFSLDVDARIPASGITGLFGRSGAGKTTLLRLIAGLDSPDEGMLEIDGDTLQDSEERLSTAVHRRRIGYVFQEPRLFPHLDVRGNLLYGYRRASGKRGFEFDTVVELLDLSSLLTRRTAGLSGGEAQRVAIARALLCSPRLVLMDEPVVALDATRKAEVMPFILKAAETLDVPILYVSHNIDEICQLCDQLLVIDGGQSIAVGELQEVLVRTDIPVLAGDEAGAVIVAGVREYDADYGLSKLITSAGPMWVRGEYARDSRVRVRLRANDVSICRQAPTDTSILNTLPARVVRIRPETKSSVLVHLQAADEQLLARITRKSSDELRLDTNDEVIAQIKSVSVRSI